MKHFLVSLVSQEITSESKTRDLEMKTQVEPAPAIRKLNGRKSSAKAKHDTTAGLVVVYAAYISDVGW